MGLGQPAVPPVLYMLSPDVLLLSRGPSPGPSHMGSEVLCHPRGALVIPTGLQTPQWPFLHRLPLHDLPALGCSQKASLPLGVPIEQLQASCHPV